MKVKLSVKVFIFLALAMVLSYLLFNWIMAAALHSRGEVIVPDLKGKTLYDALKVLSSSQLGFKLDGEEFDQDVPAGTVIRQAPAAGITVRQGKLIRVTVSQGGEVVFIPELIGQPVRTARITLRSSGLSLGEEAAKYSVVYEKEFVIGQDPKAGSIAERDSLVNLVVSAGQPPDDIKLMPNWVGKSGEQAKQWAANNAYEIDVKEEPSQEYGAGVVLQQNPAPDSDLANVAKISFVLASTDSAGVYAGKRFTYAIPAGGDDRHVKIVLLDDQGEKEIFNQAKPAGSNIEIPIDPQGQARVRIFINNVLVEERQID